MLNHLLSCHKVETGSNPTASVIWMHGLGANGYDFEPIVEQMDLKSLDAIRFVFPHAPAMPVTINSGHVMPAWYDITGGGLEHRQDKEGIEESALAIENLIKHEIASNIAPSKIVLAGFSQGCAMALFTALRYPEKLAGIIALSGYLPLIEQVKVERSRLNEQIPVFMAHGTQDGVVPMAFAQMSREQLLNWGYQVDWHEYSMAHTICPKEVVDIAKFLTKIL